MELKKNLKKHNVDYFYLMVSILKGTIMQIWKSPYMFVFRQKQYLESVVFLILRTVKLFTRKVCKFLKK